MCAGQAFKDGMGLPEFREEVAQAIEPFQPGDEVIVMADLVAGSPLTTTMDLLAGKLDLSTVRALGGMNLPMAVTAVEGEDDPLDETIQAMIECATEQVRPLAPMWAGMTTTSEHRPVTTKNYIMIRYAGLGIAMGNSPDPVKKTANRVTASNDEEGIYIALRGLRFNVPRGT